jgi:hypothetical protein
MKPLPKPYPQTRATSETSDTPGVHPGEGRAADRGALEHGAIGGGVLVIIMTGRIGKPLYDKQFVSAGARDN